MTELVSDKKKDDVERRREEAERKSEVARLEIRSDNDVIVW